MQKIVPIETSMGFLKGRDSIFLDSLTDDGISLTLKGGIINAATAPQEERPYTLIFRGCIAYFSCELDTYFNLSKEYSDSSFSLIKNSKWLKKLPIRKDFPKSMYKHYRVYTYDVIYDIIATDHELKLE